ncbi:hypothetical protein [Burkholderia dolosa]|uniref:hypothetical protein n=1 Tax=Burkholderia dolosa TaxID=152500 RepID=UPI0027D3142B|nr:hypothetical protein [Burkholderia dolosa]
MALFISFDAIRNTSEYSRRSTADNTKIHAFLCRWRPYVASSPTRYKGEDMTPLSQNVNTKDASTVSKVSPVFWKPEPVIAEPRPEPKQTMPDLRDFFAAAALQGLLSRDAGRNVSGIADYESKRAINAYRIADEMLKAR